MADTDQQREDIAAPADPAAAPTSAPADVSPGGDQMDRALADFEVATAKPATPTLDDFFSEATPDNVDALLRQDGTAADAVRHANEIGALQGRGLASELRASQSEQAVTELQQREWQRAEEADFQKFVSEAQEGLSGFNLPADYAARWLVSEAMRDGGKLRSYWDNRNNQQLDANTRASINRYLKSTLQQLWKSARSMPDPIATQDYEAVSAAVRSGQGKNPAEPPPVLGNLSDRQLNDFTKQWGYRAI